MDGDEREAQGPRRDAGIEQLADPGDVPGRFGHLGPVHPEMGAVQPRPDEGLAGRRLALGDLVLVMREDQVHAAGVDVEGRTEVGHAHRRAFDVPAGPARTDRRLPRGLARLGPLPQGEVADVVLAVLVGLDALPHPEPFGVEAGQSAVGRPRGDPEEDRAVVGPVGVAALEQRGDQVGHLVDVLGGARQDVRDGHPEGGRIGQEALEVAAGQDIDPLSGRRRAPDDLVVDVGDVEDPGDRQAAPSEVADQQVDEEERPEVADVDRGVDRGAAGIDADVALAQRDERPGQAGQGVVQLDRHRRRLDGGDRQGADRPTGALGSLEIAARCLDVDRGAVQLEQLGDRRAHRIEVGAEPRPGGDDRQVDRLRSPAVGREPADHLAQQRAAGNAGRRPGVGREEAPQVAQAGGAEQRIGDGMEGHVAIGVPVEPRCTGDLHAAQDERHVRPERVAVVPDPGPDRPRRRPAPLRPVAGRRGASP